MHIFNSSQSHTTQLQNKPAHLPCPYRLPPDSCAGSMTGVMSPAQCMPGITKEQKHTLRRGFKFQDLTEKRNVWGIKDILTHSPGNIQFLWITWSKFYLHAHLLCPHSRLTFNYGTKLSEPQLKIRGMDYFYLCVLYLAQISPSLF